MGHQGHVGRNLIVHPLNLDSLVRDSRGRNIPCTRLSGLERYWEVRGDPIMIGLDQGMHKATFK